MPRDVHNPENCKACMLNIKRSKTSDRSQKMPDQFPDPTQMVPPAEDEPEPGEHSKPPSNLSFQFVFLLHVPLDPIKPFY
ncbi:hypothetical protein HYALB_00008989 [Hymenoscyphus albidus]|uniref:Uncharacterized protein n=1 Tax=Hymenoscyphus albidus TaxID=595503 RepID=A0A9N9LQ72_9HELO|nr:hypothetical protein HYALB_00008989 [Hymenoscyphus albidus]